MSSDIPSCIKKYGKVDFLSAQAFGNRSKRQIIKVLYIVIQLYESRGFEITYFYGDGELNIQTLNYLLLTVLLYIHGKDEHVGNIER